MLQAAATTDRASRPAWRRAARGYGARPSQGLSREAFTAIFSWRARTRSVPVHRAGIARQGRDMNLRCADQTTTALCMIPFCSNPSLREACRMWLFCKLLLKTISIARGLLRVIQGLCTVLDVDYDISCGGQLLQC